MESSSLPSWKKWSKGITLKKALSRASLRQPKRRKIGVVAATATNPAEILESSKTAFTNNELLSADSSIKDNSLTESNFDQTKFYSNGDVVKDTLLTSDVSKSSPGGDSRTTNSHNSSPFTIKRNGFMTEPLQNSPNSKAEKKKRKFVNVVSKPTLDTEQSFSSSIHALKEEKSPKLKYNLRRRNTSEQFTHLGLLTPAFILHPSIHQEHILTKKLSNNLAGELQLNLAAAHITDATNGRGKFGEARAIFKPSYIKKCFRIISSKWWAGLLYITIIAHCLMTFWEQGTDTGVNVPIGYSRGSWTIHPVILIIDAICLVVYIIDIVLHTLFYNWKNIWAAKEALWIRVEFVFTCMFVIDYVILLAETFTSLRLICPFRSLRASMLLCKSKNVSHIFNVLLSIISKLGKVLLIIAIFIVTFASVGIHIFMAFYRGLNTGPCSENPSVNCTNIYEGAFDNVANAALHMFVLMSTENYPEFIIPAFEKNWPNFFFFGIFLYAGVFFLTAILLAIIVESYWDYSKRHVKVERRRQREELVKAWNLMDPLGKGHLSVDDLSLLKLFRILKPKNSTEENLELIDYLSYGDGLIDAYDWTTKLVEALSFEFEEEPELMGNNHPSNATQSKFLKSCQKICRSIVHANAVSISVLVLILLHSILFCLMWTGISDVTQLAIQSSRTGIVAIFCIEVLLRIAADGKNLLNIYDVLDMLMVLFAAIADIVWFALWFRSPRAASIDLGACVVVSGLAVLIRAVFNSKHARTAVRILRNIYPVMFDLILLVMTIIFNFAVIGFEIFQDKTLEASRARDYSGSYVEYGCNVGFETFGCSLLIVFQIVTTNDWQEIMLGAILDAGWWTCFYFLFCYLIVDMIVMNLFVAISIEAYKKLAIDNTALSNSVPENQDVDATKTPPKMETNFATSAKNTLGGIFAPSRKSKTSVSSNTLTGYTSSPYAVRRGTLGSLGQRTPTPSPRIDDRRQSLRSMSTTSHLSISNENLATAATELSPPSTTQSSGDFKMKSLERRQIQLKKRQQQRKENRKTKQDESKPNSGRRSETKLQIDDVVNLKRMVRVIKSFHARNLNEMDLKEGDMIAVSGTEQDDMLLGPKGWFPAANVKQESPKPILGHTSEHSRLSPKDAGGKPHHRVQFDVEVLEKKSRQTPPPRPRISQTRMIRRSDGADWRKDILGDMTVMNRDEAQDLNKMIRGGLGRRHVSQTTPLRNMPSQLSLRLAEELREEDEEEERALPQLTVSEVKPEVPEVKEEDPAVNNNDTNTLTLSVPMPRVPRRRHNQEKQKNSDGSMPDWMQKFVSEKQIALDKDVKLDESNPSTPGSDDGRDNKKVDVVVHDKKANLKRKRDAQTSSKA